MNDIPLGKDSTYPDTYSPDVLAPIPRAQARATLGIGDTLPFTGIDIWNAWELTWLAPGGKPVTAVAELRIPADSTYIAESKSLKLYLNSFAMTEYGSVDEVARLVESDLADVVGSPVDVRLLVGEPGNSRIDVLPGDCLDDLDVQCQFDRVDAGTLSASGDAVINESLHTHLLRSLCPVTSQPDFGSLLIEYRGRKIDRKGLLQYVVSFRQHNDFHEACVERMFIEILERCGCERLTVYARYSRRGGIDINPFRSNAQTSADNLRLWRQ